MEFKEIDEVLSEINKDIKEQKAKRNNTRLIMKKVRGDSR